MTPKNIAASVHQRLLNRARLEGRPFNELLQYYAMERFLYRLSHSAYADRLILKGALALQVWHIATVRPTLDVDLSGRLPNDENGVASAFKAILDQPVETDDGLAFDSDSIRLKRIMDTMDYVGIRVRFDGMLGSAKIHLHVDLGFGDVIYPEPAKSRLSTILDFPNPQVLVYSRESIIAEKFETMVKHGVLNSRMKDFFDIWLLARECDFDCGKLAKALSLTFQQRKTPLPPDMTRFDPAFARAKQAQWQAFRRRLAKEFMPDSFKTVLEDISGFLSPVLYFAQNGGRVLQWTHPRPWV